MIPDVFLCHNTKDKETGLLLVNLLKAALRPEPNIRFTSDPDLGLSPADNLMVLISESREANVFVALITPDSLKSTSVLLEIGARFAPSNSGPNKKLYRLRAAGANVEHLPALLQRELVSDCDQEGDLQQLIAAISTDLHANLTPSQDYKPYLQKLSDRSRKLRSSRWKENFVPLLLDHIANYDIEPDFEKFPFGELQSPGGVLFVIPSGQTVYNSANERRTPFRTRLPIEQTVQSPRSVYFAINAGNAQLEQVNKTIGQIQLEFSDSTIQPYDLVLGRNIWEWAVNNEGRLAIMPVDGTQVDRIYSGRNSSGNDSRLDALEIPILRRNRPKTLKAITFSQQNPSRAKFFVCAITVETSNQT